MQMEKQYDVVIAGAGPVGLFLACELRLAGVSVLVLEQAEDPLSPHKAGWIGVRGLNLTSTEAFYRRGMLRDLQATSLGWMNAGTRGNGMELRNGDKPAAAPAPRFAGHFAGMMLDASKVDFSNERYVIPGPSASGGMVSLEAVEGLLAERAVESGADLRFGIAVTGFSEDQDGITVEAGTTSFRAQWLVGCDGGRSTVRRAAGFEFAGTDPELTGYSASVELLDPEKLRPGFNITPTGMYVNGPMPGRIGVVDFDDAAFDRTQEITREHLQEILRRISGTDVTIKSMTLATTYTDRARQATTYRKGRVLLAGDAAHIHSPFGGQGMNAGLGDAMNLGWKLAATIHGWAPSELLDTYTTERHPIGAWALEWTRAQVAVMRPDPHARAIASIIRDLINTREGTTYFAQKVSGIGLRYDLGGSHELVGRSAPDFELGDGSRLGSHLHTGNGLLVDLTGKEAFEPLGRRWNSRLSTISTKAIDDRGVQALLVRPDGFIAWATDGEIDPAEAEQAITRWFGAPNSVPEEQLSATSLL